MRVLFVNATRTWGGIKTWMLELGTFLAARGHRVAFACRRGNPLVAACAGRGLTCHEVSFGPDYSPASVARFLRLFAAERTDLLVTNISKDLRTAGVAAAWRGLAHVNRLGNYGDLTDSWRNRWAYRSVDAVVVPSRSLAAHLSALGWLAGKVQVFPNAVRPPAFVDKAGTPVRCAVVANLSPRKQVDRVIEAFARLRNLPWELHVVGGGPARDALVRQVSDLGLSDRVRFTGVDADGAFQRIDPAVVLSDKHLGILYSAREAFGWVLLEYFAQSCAVVASRVDGIPEVVTDGVDGVLVDPDDSAALTEALVSLLVDADRRSMLARAGHDTVVRRFHQDRVFAAVEAAFDVIVQRRSAARAS